MARHPPQIAGKRAGNEAHMAAMGLEIPENGRAAKVGIRQGRRGDERVIQGIQQQSRNANGGQPWLAATARPIVLGIGKSVDGCHEVVVKFPQGACIEGLLEVEQPGELAEFLFCLWFEGGQEMTRVETIEPAGQVVSDNRQVKWCGNCCGAADPSVGLCALFSKPLEQHVAPQ